MWMCGSKKLIASGSGKRGIEGGPGAGAAIARESLRQGAVNEGVLFERGERLQAFAGSGARETERGGGTATRRARNGLALQRGEAARATVGAEADPQLGIDRPARAAALVGEVERHARQLGVEPRVDAG